MPRTARACQAGFCYHVLNRGNGGRIVFRKEGDYAAFVNLLKLAGERCQRTHGHAANRLLFDAQSLSSDAMARARR